MHETNTNEMQCNAHDDMAKCNTQANDMAMTANNWKTPGASNPGCYNSIPDLGLEERQLKIVQLKRAWVEGVEVDGG